MATCYAVMILDSVLNPALSHTESGKCTGAFTIEHFVIIVPLCLAQWIGGMLCWSLFDCAVVGRFC